MVGVLADGRMGNQMFQLAFIYSLAKKLRTSWFIYDYTALDYFDIIPQFTKINRQNCLRYIQLKKKATATVPFPSMFSRNFRRHLEDWRIKRDLIEWPNTLGGEDYLLKETKDNTLYKGYFQTEDYFKDYRSDIRGLFNLRDKHKNQFSETKEYLLRQPYIGVHIRRTDYVHFGSSELGGLNLTLPVSFYKKSLKLLDPEGTKNVVFVSDDIEYVQREFGTRKNYSFEKNNEITDFQILLHASQLIIANSTFSWWAAWLNEKAGLRVYAPKYFLGFKVNKYYPSGIQVEDWNWVDVGD